jgi:carboxypeptidase family protein
MTLVFPPVSLLAYFLNVVALSTSSPDSLHGTVRRRGHGVLPRAVMTVSRNDSSVTRILTDSSGRYVARSLAPGVYTITATHPDCQEESKRDLGVPNDSKTSIDFELQSKVYGSTHLPLPATPDMLTVGPAALLDVAGNVSFLRAAFTASWRAPNAPLGAILSASYGTSFTNALTYPTASANAPRLHVVSIRPGLELQLPNDLAFAVSVPGELFFGDRFSSFLNWSFATEIRVRPAKKRYVLGSALHFYNLTPIDFGGIADDSRSTVALEVFADFILLGGDSPSDRY